MNLQTKKEPFVRGTTAMALRKFAEDHEIESSILLGYGLGIKKKDPSGFTDPTSI